MCYLGYYNKLFRTLQLLQNFHPKQGGGGKRHGIPHVKTWGDTSPHPLMIYATDEIALSFHFSIYIIIYPSYCLWIYSN